MTITDRTGYNELPAEVITADQLVAINMRLYRVAANMRQEELGKELGWSPANVSAAERSAAEGRDRRRFDGITVSALATALGLPLAAFYLPPPDDGEGKRYLLRVGEGDSEHLLSMTDAMWLAMHDREGDGLALNAYRDRLRAAYAAYLDPKWSEALGHWLAEVGDRQARLMWLDQVSNQQRMLLEVAAGLGDVAAVLGESLEGDAP